MRLKPNIEYFIILEPQDRFILTVGAPLKYSAIGKTLATL